MPNSFERYHIINLDGYQIPSVTETVSSYKRKKERKKENRNKERNTGVESLLVIVIELFQLRILFPPRLHPRPNHGPTNDIISEQLLKRDSLSVL